MKPGWKTTEFWLAALAQLLPFLVALGVVPAADAQSISASVASVVSGVVAAIGLVSYIIQRFKLKTQPTGIPAPQVQPVRFPVTLHDCGQASEELARLKANREKLWADRANNGGAPLPGDCNFGDCDADS